MLIFDNKQSLQIHLQSISAYSSTIGFVPTMGALHQGHLSLLAKSVSQNNVTIISIFVNPTQFNNSDDLDKYPRNINNDVRKINTVSTDIIVFTPAVEDIYDNKYVTQKFEFNGLDNQMEGSFRPGHFFGVATVVKILFDIIQPTNAYFGEKDFQQLMIIKKIVTNFRLPVNIVECPIYREENGLAMSSRNELLSADGRTAASAIFETLTEVKKMYHDKATPMNKINDWVTRKFAKNTKISLEYFMIAEEKNLMICHRKSNHKKLRAFIAVYINNVRLIDTISLN